MQRSCQHFKKDGNFQISIKTPTEIRENTVYDADVLAQLAHAYNKHRNIPHYFRSQAAGPAKQETKKQNETYKETKVVRNSEAKNIHEEVEGQGGSCSF